MPNSGPALLSLGINVNRRYTLKGEERESIKVRRTDQKTVEASLVFSVIPVYDDENNDDDEEEFKEESRRNAKYGIPVGREEEEEEERRPGQFLSRSLENQSPFSGILEKIRLSRKLFHVSTSHNKLSLRGG